MKQWAKRQTGFTIVELLIVVVVIAILAAITIVAYNGIRERALVSQVQNGLSQANKKVLAYAALNGDRYPDTLADAGVTDGSVTYEYSSNNTTNPKEYVLTASNGVAGSISFYTGSTVTGVQQGIAPGHNLIAWNKTDSSTASVVADTGVSIDTSQFRTSTASIRLSPSAVSKSLRSSPFTGTPGQIITVSLYIRSDSNWNGTGNNSKIRFGNASSSGALLKACSYDGAKITWTFVTCDYTFTGSVSSAQVSVGNDGSTGNIWLDDISVSIK